MKFSVTKSHMLMWVMQISICDPFY